MALGLAAGVGPFDATLAPRLVAERGERSATWRAMAAAALPVTDALAIGAAMTFAGTSDATRVACGLLIFAALRFERPARLRLSLRVSEQLSSVVARVAIAGVAGAYVTTASDAGNLLRALPLVALLVIAERSAVFAALRTARAKGALDEPTIILGAGRVGQQCADGLVAHREYGLVPVGFVDCAVDALDDGPRDLPVLGDLPSLAWIVSQLGVRRAVVAFGGHREHEMVDAMRECARLGVATYVVPRFFELGVCPDGSSTDRIWGMRLVYARPPMSTTTARVAKRALDIAVAGTVLVVASPLFLVAAIATKLSSPGPIFFKQRRVGRGGAPIDVLKFRSMRVNDESDTAWSVPEERITRVGKFLRDTSIDELPQLITVLRGDMSVVGPRPERRHFVDQFNETVDHYDDRHRMPVGLSGWAQVHGLRGDTSIEDRVQFDNDYIEHWSIWLDVMILVRTASAVVRGAFSKASPGDPLQ